MTDNPSISARHDAALEGIAAAGREIAGAIRGHGDLGTLLGDARASEGAARDAVDVAQAEVERLRAEVVALREIGPHIRKIWTSPSKEVREVLDAVDVLTEQAQDATPVPAEQPQGESGGSGSTGGVTHVSVGRFPGFRPGDVVMGPCPVTGGVIVERQSNENGGPE